jgi:hypothetical protein
MDPRALKALDDLVQLVRNGDIEALAVIAIDTRRQTHELIAGDVTALIGQMQVTAAKLVNALVLAQPQAQPLLP